MDQRRGKQNTPLGKRDHNKIDMRREFVAAILAQGISNPSDVIKRIRADSQAAFLIDGYENVYKLIVNDITAVKRGYRKRGDNSVVTIEARGALTEYVARQDQIYNGAWETIRLKLENGELDGKELSALFETASDAAEAKAKALGVDTENARTARIEESDHARPLIENAIIATNPAELMAAFDERTKLAQNAPEHPQHYQKNPPNTGPADADAPDMSRGDYEVAIEDAAIRLDHEDGNPLVQVLPKDE